MRVVVCGAGVIGACVAYYLAERGVGATVVERSAVAAAASGKAGGFLALDWCDGSPVAALARASFRLHAALAARPGADWGYRRLDTFQVVAAESRGVAGYRRAAGPAWLDPARAAAYGVLGTPATTAQVHPERFTRAMLDAALARGARLVAGRVEALVAAGAPRRVIGVRVDGAEIAADAVVVALGPWTGGFSAALGLPPVAGLKGYSVTLRPPDPVGPHALFVDFERASGERLSPEVYPRPDGEVYVCGLSEHAALPDDPDAVAVDAAACERLRGVAATLAPALRGVAVERAQACYRPICADGMPLLGAVPGMAGAYVATAHSCWGILNAPASGAAMAELVATGASSGLDLAPFDPRRLAADPGPRRARAVTGAS